MNGIPSSSVYWYEPPTNKRPWDCQKDVLVANYPSVRFYHAPQNQLSPSAIKTNNNNDMYRSVATEQRAKTAINVPQPVLNNLFLRSKTCTNLGRPNETNQNESRLNSSHPNPQDLSCFDLKQANKAIYNHDLMNHLLLKRFKYVHSRPKYCVRIDMEKLKPDPAADVTRVNAAQTYFYNTIPAKKASFTIDPNFASESILDYRRRSKSCTNLSSGKIRRDYAFVY